MKNKRKILIWISSVAIVILISYLLLVFGSVSFFELLLILGFITIIGLLVGLIPYKKINYLNKIQFTIPLVIFLFGLYSLFVYVKVEHGIFKQYNYFTAKRDIKEGTIQIVTYGLPGDNSQDIRKIAKEYGFNYINLGCILNNYGFEEYNKVMYKYLDELNGKGWKNEMDSLINKNFEKMDTSVYFHRKL